MRVWQLERMKYESFGRIILRICKMLILRTVCSPYVFGEVTTVEESQLGELN